jgi:pilus assembly protein CpaC
MYTRFFWRLLALSAVSWFFASTIYAQEAAPVIPLTKPSILFKVKNPDDRLEMIIHTSRILSTEGKIVQIEPGNHEILDMTTLSPNQVQITAKALGVTQVSLWDENKNLYTISVLVVGDSRELALMLRSAFPDCALKVIPVKDAVMISGFVDKNEHIDQIVTIAEQYYPKVINGMTVSGVQQVLLHIKVMEVSRTKLRKLGFDWGKITGTNYVTSAPTSLLSDYNPSALTSPPNLFRTATPGTFAFNVGSGSAAFFGVLDALEQDNLMKIMSEPTLVAISGEQASFNSGGKIPVPTPQSLGTLSIEWQNYGTQIKFVAIVLGGGVIRLQVQPLISELDSSTGTTIAGTTVPGIKSRDASTSVQMMAGQTLAIAGLVQTKIEAEKGGLPWVSDVPYLGAAFRHVKELRNEVELLILVTPELIEPLDSNEVPPCGPGMQTTSPNDLELYMKGHLEVPKRCPTGAACGNRGGSNCGPDGDNSSGPPSDGMIGTEERIPTPQPSNEDSHRKPNNRHTPSKPNSPASSLPSGSPDNPPGFIGPVGYDVVK